MKKKQESKKPCTCEEIWAEASYSTGSTRPPKSHGGLIAFLLVMVIFLCGLSTALGLMNIRLLGVLSEKEEDQTAPMAFSQDDSLETADDDAIRFPLGFSGQEVPAFWQNYDGLPEGIYVVEVTCQPNSRSLGLQPGDVLTQINGTTVESADTLLQLLQEYEIGDPVDVTIIRSGEEYTITLTLESE